MICRNCGGQIPDGSKICSFCETEICKVDKGNLGELTDLEKKMSEILMGSGCGGCPGAADEEGVPKPSWWKEGNCSGCGGGLTGTDKDLKYALTIVGLVVGVIVFALGVKFFFGS